MRMCYVRAETVAISINADRTDASVAEEITLYGCMRQGALHIYM
jgi:hypothetical protein